MVRWIAPAWKRQGFLQDFAGSLQFAYKVFIDGFYVLKKLIFFVIEKAGLQFVQADIARFDMACKFFKIDARQITRGK